MRHLFVGLTVLCLLALSAPSQAQTSSAGPPANAMKLSEIIARVEKRPGFQYVERVTWFNDAYIVVFYTTEKARVEIHFDPTTGQPK
jgi:hypothetical protein